MKKGHSAPDAGHIPEATYRRAVVLFTANERFVLTTHRDPDGDGLGAQAALAEALEQLGKEVRVINSSPVPAHYRFLRGSGTFERYREATHRAVVEGADVVILLDAAHPERTGRLAPALLGYRGVTLAIDHHQLRGWAQLDLVDPDACATTELIDELLARLSVTLTPSMAEALYAGLVADTLAFRTAHTTAAVHNRAARLLEAGANLARVHEALFASWPLGRLKLQGHFLARLRTAVGGRLVWGVVERRDFRRWRQTPAAVEGLVENALSVRDADLAMLFLEEPASIRLSLRSRHGVRVDGVARALGGGGHAQAAGARVSGPLPRAVRLAVSLAKQTLVLSEPR
jgi:phosphoesterase RecJ-like protein